MARRADGQGAVRRAIAGCAICAGGPRRADGQGAVRRGPAFASEGCIMQQNIYVLLGSAECRTPEGSTILLPLCGSRRMQQREPVDFI